MTNTADIETVCTPLPVLSWLASRALIADALSGGSLMTASERVALEGLRAEIDRPPAPKAKRKPSRRKPATRKVRR